MGTHSDVRAATVTETGSVYGDRTRVKAMAFFGSGTGSIVLKDGGSSGKTELTLATPSGYNIVYIPGDGIVFGTDVHATLTNVSSLTVFYG